MAKKQLNKKIRKQIKITEQLNDIMTQQMEDLGVKSFNRLVDIALFMYYTDSSNFICCPKCNTHAVDRHIITVNGTFNHDCKCGNHFVYDLDENVFLKGE